MALLLLLLWLLLLLLLLSWLDWLLLRHNLCCKLSELSSWLLRLQPGGSGCS